MSDYVYANLLGKWKRLEGLDEVNSMPVDKWASENMGVGEPVLQTYLHIQHKKSHYTVHPAQIMMARED
jgi:hypothetical protein